MRRQRGNTGSAARALFPKKGIKIKTVETAASTAAASKATAALTYRTE